MKRRRQQQLVLAFCVGALYVALRAALAERTLDHDEMYNTARYLTLKMHDSSHLMTWRHDWRRQLGIHPPLLTVFYFLWIRIFGDSELSLRIPPLVAGLLTLLLTYSVGRRIFDRRVGLLAACGLALAGSHIAYSLFAIHAIFDMLFMLLALHALVAYAQSREPSHFRWVVVADIAGFTHFYYFITVLVPQAVYLFTRRRTLYVPRAYFLFAGALSLLFAIPVVAGYSSTYDYTWWGRGSLANAERLLAALFLYDPYEAHGELTRWVAAVFLALALASIVSQVVVATRRPADALPILLVGTFLVPLSIYWVGGWLDKPVGHQRTYFYLLPIYFLLIFDFLGRLLRTTPRIVACSAPLLALILVSANSSLDRIYSASPVLGVLRENRVAGRQGSQILIHDTGNIEWPARYYLSGRPARYEASFFRRLDDVRAFVERHRAGSCQPLTVMTSDESVARNIEDDFRRDSMPFQAEETQVEIPSWFGYSSSRTEAFQLTSRVGVCSTQSAEGSL